MHAHSPASSPRAVLDLDEVQTDANGEVGATLTKVIAAELDRALLICRLYHERESVSAQALHVLHAATQAHDHYTAAHEQGVAELAVRVAGELGLEASEQQTVRFAALTHDLGKIAVPALVLHKDGPLAGGEWQIMRRHPIIGADLLGRIPFFAEVHPLVRAHHERWDGSGYPDGLSGTRIPLGSRILSVCDAYDAMVTDRPYRTAMTPAQARAELRRQSGTHFETTVVAALLRSLD